MPDKNCINWKQQSLTKISHYSGRFYSYAASVIADKGTTHVWWCQNERDGIIRDTVFYTAYKKDRKAISPPLPILHANEAPRAWDGFHICDPSIIGGDFDLSDGMRAKYALFYLGNDVNASRHNQIGVAFARDLRGPWTRLFDPLVGHDDPNAWGVGQPSAISLDKHGRILLFYTIGDKNGTRAMCREFDLSYARRPIISSPTTLPNTGLTGADGKPDYLNNADFAYCSSERRFWVVREQHPYPLDTPRYIGTSLQIASLAESDVRTGHGAWRIEGEITTSLTGFARNHNAGFVRTCWGELPDATSLSVVFASSEASPSLKTPEWTYELWQIDGVRSPPK